MQAKIYQIKSKYLQTMETDTTGRELNSLEGEIKSMVEKATKD